MEETLNLEDIFKVIKDNLLTIVASVLIFGAIAAFGTAFFMTPQYQTTTQVLVNQSDSEQFDNQDIQASISVINTYRDIINSPAILGDVVDNLNLTYGANTLRNKITVNNENQSQVINITVEDENPQDAEVIANEIASVFSNNVLEIMSVDNVSILTQAEIGENPSPVSPQPLVNIAIGLILGGLLGLGIAFLRAFMDKRVQTEEDVEKYLGLPVLGTIPRFDK